MEINHIYGGLRKVGFNKKYSKEILSKCYFNSKNDSLNAKGMRIHFIIQDYYQEKISSGKAKIKIKDAFYGKNLITKLLEIRK